jgi:hypothetical protein
LALPPHFRGLVFAALLLLAVPAGVDAAKGTANSRGPEWGQLTPDQQKILAPLAQDWPNFEGPRRTKWVEIAKRYPKMTPQEQQRLQSRMKQWASMTPEQHAQVRERYKKLKAMPPEKREAIQRKWHEYEGLSEEEKKALRQAHPGQQPAAAAQPKKQQ